MHRLKVISGHLSPAYRRDLGRAECGAAARSSSPEDVVVVHGRRTAVGKAKRGAFNVRHLSRDTWADRELSIYINVVIFL